MVEKVTFITGDMDIKFNNIRNTDSMDIQVLV